jgi:hypothetical protein
MFGAILMALCIVGQLNGLAELQQTAQDKCWLIRNKPSWNL